jgi:hypothetical protein
MFENSSRVPPYALPNFPSRQQLPDAQASPRVLRKSHGFDAARPISGQRVADVDPVPYLKYEVQGCAKTGRHWPPRAARGASNGGGPREAPHAAEAEPTTDHRLAQARLRRKPLCAYQVPESQALARPSSNYTPVRMIV